MTQEREDAAQDEDAGGAGPPFDDDPPVDTSEPQVGNSKAKFLIPRDEETGEGAGGTRRGKEQRVAA